LQDYNF